MATAETEHPASSETRKDPNLRYLGFVHEAIIRVVALVAWAYDFAKENSGPLKPGVDSVESTVKTVVRPVYHKLEGKPAELLEIIDRQVDEVLSALKQFLPQFFKERSMQAYQMARQAPEVAKSVAGDLQKRGVIDSARDYYVKYEPVAEEWVQSAWCSAMKLPVVPQMVQVAAPAAMFGFEKFNSVVVLLRDNKVPLADYVPVIPVEKVQRVINMEPIKQH